MVSDSREDCYFYLSQTCSKGSACAFRHSEAAKENLNVCTDWLNSKTCSTDDCQLKHSTYHLAQTAQKDKSQVQCYWDKSGGCTRPNCYFMHTNKPADTAPVAKGPITSGNTSKGTNPNAQAFTPRANVKPYEKKSIINTKSFADYAPKVNTSNSTIDSKANAEKSISILSNQPTQNSISILKRNGANNGKVTQLTKNTNQHNSLSQSTFKTAKGDFISRVPNSINSFEPQSKKQPSNTTIPLAERLGQVNGSNNTTPKDKREKKVDRPEKVKKLQILGTKNDESDKKFSEIKVKTLQEILAEKRKKQAAEATAASSTPTATNGHTPNTQNSTSIYKISSSYNIGQKAPIIQQPVKTSPEATQGVERINMMEVVDLKGFKSVEDTNEAVETLVASGNSEKRAAEEDNTEKTEEPLLKKTKEEKAEEEKGDEDMELDFDLDDFDLEGFNGELPDDLNLDDLVGL